jgi:hypothetical protein
LIRPIDRGNLIITQKIYYPGCGVNKASVVTSVTLDGSIVSGVDVKAGTHSPDLDVWELISSSSLFWRFSPSGGELSFRGVRIISFFLGLGQVQLKLEGETFVALVVGDILYISLLLTQTVNKPANSI